MPAPRDWPATLTAIRTVLATDLACPEPALSDDGVTVVVARQLPGRRRFPPPSRALGVVTMGAGVVVSCHPSRLAWARATLAGQPRDAIFAGPLIARLARYVGYEGQDLRGPTLNYACAADIFHPADMPPGVTLTLLEGAAIAELYQMPGFGHALGYRIDHPRPDMVAAVATLTQDLNPESSPLPAEGTAVLSPSTIIGVAGASADSDTLWQIGVDVLPGHQGQGIGRALVSQVTAALLARGIVPHYATAIANLRSGALALSLGYRLAWVELYAHDRPFAPAPSPTASSVIRDA
jgi:GNAT superfamily N-acetyltransferase